MTLCAVWRRDGAIHFASDSRLTLGSNVVDIAIKVARAPYRIFSPYQNGTRQVLAEGDLGMCFAGNAIGALFLRESIIDLLTEMQAVPDYHDISMENIADFVFRAYRFISKALAEKLFEKALSTVVMAGFCPVEQRLRAFHLKANQQNDYFCDEVLLNDPDHLFIGSGASVAQTELTALSTQPSNIDVLNVVRKVIKNSTEASVGGNLQYGTFKKSLFQTYGVLEVTNGDVHYWRGGLDLHTIDFDNSKSLFLGYPYIDLAKL